MQLMPQQGSEIRTVHRRQITNSSPSAITPFKAVAIFNDLVYITEYDNEYNFNCLHILPMNTSKSTYLYCACMNNENIYRHYPNDRKAISAFKLIAIKKYAKLTDITKKVENKWTRIRWS